MNKDTIFLGLLTFVLSVNTGCKKEYEGNNLSMVLLQTAKKGGLKSLNHSYWGGSVIKSEDVYHMFVSTFENGCGLETWKHNSKIVHAISKHPLGPFQVKETIIPAMAHNPSIRKTKEGKYILFFIGELLAEEELVSLCDKGVTNTKDYQKQHTRSCIVNYIEADNIEGPWSEPKTILDLSILPNCPTNPSPLIMPDGKVKMYYRAYEPDIEEKQRHLYLTEAESYKGPYNQTSSKIIKQLAEDPYVWYMNNEYHVLFNNKFYDPLNTGGYATSKDGVSFQVEQPLYSRKVDFDDGTLIVFSRRERPHFLRIDKKRAVLYTGVRQSDSKGDYTYIIATPVGKWTERQLMK